MTERGKKEKILITKKKEERKRRRKRKQNKSLSPEYILFINRDVRIAEFKTTHLRTQQQT